MGLFKNLTIHSAFEDLDLFAKSKYNPATLDYDIGSRKVTWAQMKAELNANLTNNLASSNQVIPGGTDRVVSGNDITQDTILVFDNFSDIDFNAPFNGIGFRSPSINLTSQDSLNFVTISQIDGVTARSDTRITLDSSTNRQAFDTLTLDEKTVDNSLKFLQIQDNLGTVDFVNINVGAGVFEDDILNATIVTDVGLSQATTITHGLNSDNITVELWDLTTGERFSALLSNRTANAVDVTFSSVPTGDVEIIVVGGQAITGVGGNTAITLNRLAIGTGSDIQDGTWEIVGNDLLPLTTFSHDIGSPSKGINDLFAEGIVTAEEYRFLSGSAIGGGSFGTGGTTLDFGGSKIVTTIPSSTTAQINFKPPNSPVDPVGDIQDGDMWFDGVDVKFRVGGVTEIFSFGDNGIYGGSGTIPALTTATITDNLSFYKDSKVDGDFYSLIFDYKEISDFRFTSAEIRVLNPDPEEAVGGMEFYISDTGALTKVLTLNGNSIEATTAIFSNLLLIGLPTHADELAAAALITNTIYKTATGEIRIKL